MHKICLGVVAELPTNNGQTLVTMEEQEEKHKRINRLTTESSIFKKGTMKENKANFTKRYQERAEKNCERECSPRFLGHNLMVILLMQIIGL